MRLDLLDTDLEYANPFGIPKLRNILLVLVLAYVLLLIWPLMIKYGNGVITSSPVRLPWLLESGLVDATEAEVRLILWYEEDDIPPVVIQELEREKWEWTLSEKVTGADRRAATVSAERLVTREEEPAISQWYQEFAPKVRKSGGYLYLDERVPGVVDIAAYLAEVDAKPKQWVWLDQGSSIAAYRKDRSPSIQAGSDLINLQVMTRSGSEEGKSVLALPALLEEF
ncbi:hypothetical protein [Paradesulfitobacterium ferrireducens]|uniref:hypothetical protein n=1 Tax=Paradesulfitobacterium ferrireducens TaxID=2816476 RepID=UPI001A8D536B|nr:hypothetical protein [Paradesulfitobacterium ferrireducens]